MRECRKQDRKEERAISGEVPHSLMSQESLDGKVLPKALSYLPLKRH